MRTADLEATIRFYTEWLGCRVETLWPAPRPTFCILDRDGVSFSFWTEEDGGSREPVLSGQIQIDVEDVEELHAALVDHVAIEWGPEVYHYGRREFAIRDPNGYRLVFSEPTDEPPTCPEP